MRMLARVRRETMEAHPENHTLRELFRKADELFDKQSRPGAKKDRELEFVREILGILPFGQSLSVGGVPCIRFGKELDSIGENDDSCTVLSENFFEVFVDTAN
jgi:hypothetical protein